MRPSSKTTPKILAPHKHKPIAPSPITPPLGLPEHPIYSTMSSEGPIPLSRRSSVAFPNDSPSEHPDKRRASTTKNANSSLPTFSDFSKTASVPNSPMTTAVGAQQQPPQQHPSTSSTNGRSLHTLYPNSTPPMSPGVMLSPVSRPHYGITDPSHYSSSGFYQLPPPLQGDVRDSGNHRSPAIHSPTSSSVHPLNPIQLPPLSPLTIGNSPRSTPQHSHMNHHTQGYPPSTSSTISPYPTPQHHPQHFSSPHQSPRYDRILPKQSIPAMNLPASALASSTSVFQVAPSRPSLSSYPPVGDRKGSSSSSFGGSTTPQFSPHTSAIDSHNRSAPGSPQRYLMLPPQVAPTSSSSTPSAPQGSSTRTSKKSSSSSSSSSKRRSSSSAKAVDQETRDMMRKVSHSAIERRRRERINDKILQLKHLVPSCVDEDHLHKLSILQSTIEYIQHLKTFLPDEVVNSQLKKATNNNPNNKTTDMLEAMGGMISSKPQHHVMPMLTTGLGQHRHPPSTSPSSYPLYASPTPLAVKSRSRGSDASQPEEDRPVGMEHRHSTSSSSSSSSSHSMSSDEDAKDGLLLLHVLHLAVKDERRSV
ncbi:hypothetical protein CPB97_002162 [Podila verticillata]|nr:hypothetical protein CPB97_002162 [Podila verticillata]